MKEHWKEQPDPHDYPAAQDYLSLVMSDERAEATVNRLQEAVLIRRKAKDLLRASGLPLLPKSNFHVAADLRKVKSGRRLSPVLLVRGDAWTGRPLIIADGYHRICASYHIGEDSAIPCRLADVA